MTYNDTDEKKKIGDSGEIDNSDFIRKEIVRSPGYGMSPTIISCGLFVPPRVVVSRRHVPLSRNVGKVRVAPSPNEIP